MNTILALTLGGPLMLLFGILMAVVLGAAGGYMVGTSFGRTRPETPLPTTLRITRERLQGSVGEIEKASRKLTSAQRGELAGHALVASKRVTDLSAALGRIGRKARHHEEGSA